MKKKLICLLLVMAMATSVFATVATANQRQEMINNDQVQELTQEEMAAVDAGITLEELEEAYSHGVIGTLLEAGLRYRIVELSYDDLLAISHEISAITAQRYTDYQCIFSYNLTILHPDMFTNKVVVGIVEYNDYMIEGFRRYVYDSPVLMFQQIDQIDLGGGSGDATFHYSDAEYHSNYFDLDYHQEIYQEIVPFSTTINTGTMVRSRHTLP